MFDVVVLRSSTAAAALLFLMLRCPGVQAEVSPAAPIVTRYFAFDDERYLSWPQRHSGAVLLPLGASSSAVPVIVLLHGVNPSREPHLWLGGGERDLRPLAESLMRRPDVEPFVLAAPSQTRSAISPQTLWSGLSLGAFVEALAGVTDGDLQIDRSRVVLMGHSGAGCNPSGGLAGDFYSAGQLSPWAIVSIDPCLDFEMGTAMSRRPSTVPLLLWWQSAVWPREPLGFWHALTLDKPEQRLDRMQELRLASPNPHAAVVPAAFELAVRELFALSAQTTADDESN
jgi:hypothetical protein